MNHSHRWIRTEEISTAEGGALSICSDEDEVFLDAEVCLDCGCLELLVHESALSAPLLARFFPVSGEPCPRCQTSMLDLGFRVCGQGGGEIHAPLDSRWTLGMASRACLHCGRVWVRAPGGGHKPEAPPNRTLLLAHRRVEGGTCSRCGQEDLRSLEVEAFHCGAVALTLPGESGRRMMEAQVCVACENIVLCAVPDSPA
jgi:hypothetical protein